MVESSLPKQVTSVSSGHLPRHEMRGGMVFSDSLVEGKPFHRVLITSRGSDQLSYVSAAVSGIAGCIGYFYVAVLVPVVI